MKDEGSFDFQYYKTHKMVYTIDSCVQQLLIPKWLFNQIYIVAHRWEEEILSFLKLCHSSKSVTCIKPQVPQNLIIVICFLEKRATVPIVFL